MILINYFDIAIELHILPLDAAWSSSVAIKHACSFLLHFYFRKQKHLPSAMLLHKLYLCDY